MFGIRADYLRRTQLSTWANFWSAPNCRRFGLADHEGVRRLKRRQLAALKGSLLQKSGPSTRRATHNLLT